MLLASLLVALAPVVHVESELGTRVVVERVDDHGRAAAVCVAPCDERLDPRGTYRLSSDTFRTTNRFRIETTERAVDVRVEPRTKGTLVSAVVLMTVSGLFATGGAAAIAWGALDTRINNVGVATAIAIPMITVSLATGIPGVVLLAKSVQSRATVTAADRAVAATSNATPRPAGFTVPILTKTF
jgi:hypothetical protein